MDVDGRRGCKPSRQIRREPGLQQPAQPPGNDVDRRAVSPTLAARREVIDRHTWLVSYSGSDLTDMGVIR